VRISFRKPVSFHFAQAGPDRDGIRIRLPAGQVMEALCRKAFRVRNHPCFDKKFEPRVVFQFASYFPDRKIVQAALARFAWYHQAGFIRYLDNSLYFLVTSTIAI